MNYGKSFGSSGNPGISGNLNKGGLGSDSSSSLSCCCRCDDDDDETNNSGELDGLSSRVMGNSTS